MVGVARYCVFISGHAWLDKASAGDGTMDMKKCMIIIHVDAYTGVV